MHHYHKFHEKYVKHNNRFIKFIDGAVYIVGTFGACMTIPQIYSLYSSKSAESLSFFSWCGFLCAALFWFIYGLTHKSRPIVFINSLWIIFDILMIIGITIY